MLMKSEAAFFDMGETLYTYDGVPLNWKAHYPAAWTEALTCCGHTITASEMERLIAYLSRFNTREHPREEEYSADLIIGEALKEAHLEHIPAEDVIQAFFSHFRQTLTPYEETEKALERLRMRKIYIGALTDVAYGMPREFIEDDLRQVGILELFDSWKTSVEVGFRKPNPKGFAALCDEAGCPPNRAIYVGNERKDVQGANNAGLISVLIHRADTRAPDWGQKRTIRSLLECEIFFE